MDMPSHIKGAPVLGVWTHPDTGRRYAMLDRHYMPPAPKWVDPSRYAPAPIEDNKPEWMQLEERGSEVLKEWSKPKLHEPKSQRPTLQLSAEARSLLESAREEQEQHLEGVLFAVNHGTAGIQVDAPQQDPYRPNTFGLANVVAETADDLNWQAPTVHREKIDWAYVYGKEPELQGLPMLQQLHLNVPTALAAEQEREPLDLTGYIRRNFYGEKPLIETEFTTDMQPWGLQEHAAETYDHGSLARQPLHSGIKLERRPVQEPVTQEPWTALQLQQGGSTAWQEKIHAGQTLLEAAGTQDTQVDQPDLLPQLLTQGPIEPELYSAITALGLVMHQMILPEESAEPLLHMSPAHRADFVRALLRETAVPTSTVEIEPAGLLGTGVDLAAQLSQRQPLIEQALQTVPLEHMPVTMQAIAQYGVWSRQLHLTQAATPDGGQHMEITSPLLEQRPQQVSMALADLVEHAAESETLQQMPEPETYATPLSTMLGSILQRSLVQSTDPEGAKQQRDFALDESYYRENAPLNVEAFMRTEWGLPMHA